MFDTDKFIELVRGEPALWDKSCKDYSSRVHRDMSWLAVATKMFTDWNDLDMKEIDIRGKELRNKWRHIKDEFNRQINKSKSGDPAPSKKKKTYRWAEALSFLQNSATKRNTSSNLKGDELAEEFDDNVDVETVDDQQESESAVNVPTPTVPVPKLKTLDVKTRKNSKLSTFQEQLLKKLDASKKSDDTDRMFLLSMLPEYKELNNEEKLDFKLMALQFFRGVQQKKYFQSQLSSISQFDINQQLRYRPQTSNQNIPPGFLSDQDNPRVSRSKVESCDDGEDEENETHVTNKQEMVEQDESTESWLEATSQSVAIPSTSVPPTPQSQTRKRDDKNYSMEGMGNEVLLQGNDYFKRPRTEEDRFDVISKGFAIKLRGLPKEQMLLAEKLMNETLFLAEMGSLTMSHRVVGESE